MNTPKISVVLPVFNAQAHLETLLTSLLNQSESSIEIVTVDDGSTDGSIQILQQVAQRDGRLLVLSQGNHGVSSARNYGLTHARGRWIAFADSDDWLNPKTLEVWYKRAEHERLDFLVGNGFHFVEGPAKHVAAPSLIFQLQPWDEIVNGEEWIIRSVAAEEWPHYVWLQLASRDFILRSNAQFVEGIVHEDILWTLHLALKARRIGFFREPLYGYRINPGSIMSSQSQRAIEARAQSYITVIQHLVTTASNSHSAALRRALLRHANREGGHLLGLMRKKIDNPTTRQVLARRFFQLDLPRAMFSGAADVHELWRAVRCWAVLRRHAHGTAQQGAQADGPASGGPAA